MLLSSLNGFLIADKLIFSGTVKSHYKRDFVLPITSFPDL